MSNITPAPWAVHNSMRDCVTFEGQYGQENLFLMNIDGYYACQNEDDARLIAAAPDLLAAVQGLLNLFEQHEKRGHTISPVGDFARAAVHKATGAA